jgi:hypothetical protein
MNRLDSDECISMAEMICNVEEEENNSLIELKSIATMKGSSATGKFIGFNIFSTLLYINYLSNSLLILNLILYI